MAIKGTNNSELSDTSDDQEYFGYGFHVNRGHAQYNPFEDSFRGRKSSQKKTRDIEQQLAPSVSDEDIFIPVTDISQVPVKQQRRIRENLNFGKPREEQILYEHIKPGSADFKKKYAKIIVDCFNAKRYLRFLENKKNASSLSDTASPLSELTEDDILHRFKRISPSTRKKIMIQLGIPPENISKYTLENKKKVVAAYEEQKMEKTLDRQFKQIPVEVRKEIMHGIGKSPENISHYKKSIKKKIISIFKSEF